MNRRSFIATTGTVFGAIAAHPRLLLGRDLLASDTVEKVHVIFKTHLDVGFTDLAANVINMYFNQFIPNLLSLTEQIDREGRQDRYNWTTGSWLIYRYLEIASPENRQRMERAIERGDIFWHGLPFSTHTELMDESLLHLATTYSARLDRRFQRKTIAAKMTDVPCHSRGLAPVLAEAGLELLHIQANDGSAGVDVPPLFVWRSPDGSDLTVMFQHATDPVSFQRMYCHTEVLPRGRTAVSMNLTGEGTGPHTPEQIAWIYDNLRKRFPKARIFASDLSTVALEVRALKPQLPVVTQEMGDTWIHGPGSDPYLMARYRELARLRREWIVKGALTANGDVDAAFGEHLLLVPEHTWGLNIERLGHWNVYNMTDFRASRGLPDFKIMEQSWAEKRARVDAAVSTMPPALAAEAGARLQSLRPVRMDRSKLRGLVSLADLHDTKHFRLGFDPKSGAIRSLEHRETGRQWAGRANTLGLLTYQTFAQPEFDRFMDQYIPKEKRHEEWAINSWSKQGLDKSDAKSALYFTTLKHLWHEKRQDGELFLADLEVPEAGDSGCPREITVETFLPENEPTVRQTLKWFNKAASRLPEALWFSFVPLVSGDGQFEFDKIGQAVSSLDVVRNGNRNMHGVIKGVSYRDKRSGFELDTLDAFLVAPGRRSLLIFDNEQPDVAGGLHFCLYNNLTGTNFTMWFEDDMQFRFTIDFGR
jgi:hypothetical protein